MITILHALAWAYIHTLSLWAGTLTIHTFFLFTYLWSPFFKYLGQHQHGSVSLYPLAEAVPIIIFFFCIHWIAIPLFNIIASNQITLSEYEPWQFSIIFTVSHLFFLIHPWSMIITCFNWSTKNIEMTQNIKLTVLIVIVLFFIIFTDTLTWFFVPSLNNSMTLSEYEHWPFCIIFYVYIVCNYRRENFAHPKSFRSDLDSFFWLRKPIQVLNNDRWIDH